MNRKGIGKNKGQGYKNILPQDSFIHELNRRGIKKKDIFMLPIQTAIIVPSTTDKDKFISKRDFNKRLRNTRTEMSDLFGGYTSVESVGEFTDKDGNKIPEPNNTVIAYTNKETFQDKKDEFSEFIKKKKKEWKQESIGVIIENDLFFVG